MSFLSMITYWGITKWFTQKPDPDTSSWSERVAGWVVSQLASGVTKFTEDLEPGMIDQMRESLTKLREAPELPTEYKGLIDKALAEGNIGEVISGWALTILGVLPALLSMGGPAAKAMGYAQEKVARTYVLDPIQVITAWRRDPAKYEQYFEDLRYQGWSEERIEALKFFTEAYPTPRDIVGFLAHEVFEPDMIAKYGLLSEWDVIDKEPAKKIGLMEDILKLYWMDHWEHPEWGTIRELRHRDQIDDKDVRDWFRLVEIPEYWRDKMLNVLWGLPNRIEIRMMARYLDMSKEEVMDLLKKAGLHEDYRSDAADFMIIMGLQGYWATLYRNGWLSREELTAEIEARGISPAIADRVYKRIVKNELAERSAKDRDLTVTDIFKGVKTGRISRAEAVDLLMELGYDEDEAWFKLDVNIPPDEEEEVERQRELTKTDIYNALKEKIITEGEALTRLLGLRYSSTDAQLLLDIFKARIQPPPEPRAREASKADIVLAVKKGLITPEQGYLMLLDIGFSPEAAEFILQVRAEVSPFSPVSYEEFKELTARWRKAAGRPEAVEHARVREAAAIVVEATKEVEDLRAAVAEEQAKIVDEEATSPEELKPLKRKRIALHRAEAALQKAKQDYDRLVAEVKHAPPEK